MTDILNRPVNHVKFGAGVIKSCENGTMQVYFTQYGARFFHYPEAFDKFLKTDDEALMMQVDIDLATWRMTRAAEESRLAGAFEEAIKTARPVKKSPVRRRSTTKTPAKSE